MFADTFANAKLSAKVLISPLILVCSMLILAIIFQLAISSESAALADLHKAAQHSRFIARLDADSTRIQSNSYRLLGWASAGVEADKVQNLEQKIRADIKTLVDDSKTFGAAMIDEDDKALLAPVLASLAAYHKAVLDVADMAAVDAVTGLIMMTSAEIEFDNLQNLIENLVAAGNEDETKTFTQAQAVGDSAKAKYYLVFALCLAIAGILVTVITRLISRPVNEITLVMNSLAAGDMSVEVHSQDRKDEIGAMARAVSVFQDGMRRAAALEAEKTAQVMAGAELAERREALTSDFNSAMDHMLQAVMATVEQVHSSSDSLQQTAEQTSLRGAAVAKAASGAAADVDTVASAAEELGASVQEISRQITSTVEITDDAVRSAHAANETMNSLDETARRIGEVVTMINTIAGQTNLLALNATIEAARAGDAGKGFAVVANEVKHLANQTAKATDEISTQIAAVQTATHDAVDRIRNVGDTIDKVSGIVASIASAVEEQSAATQEIVRSVQRAAEGNGEVSRNIVEVSRAAEETGDMARTMFSAADDLLAEANELKGEVSAFLASMRG